MAEVYLVGGAVRDLVLGLKPKDLDFVVVGSSPEEMLSLGFFQVGKDFPVFLHPETGDEFALARKERKVGNGYKGFQCEWEGVTLEEDLARRDLTINAMAIDIGVTRLNQLLSVDFDVNTTDFSVPVWEMSIVDPFGGRKHIKDKVLEGVSEHFREDPLRVLRVARFLARLGNEWTISGALRDELEFMVKDGLLNDLTPERVCREMQRALMEDHPQIFFEFICSLDWDGVKEITALRGVEQRSDFHPEGDAFIHTMLCLKQSARNGNPLPSRFATLCHDFGKRPAYDYNRSKGENHLGGHEAMGLPLIDNLCNRWKVDNNCRKLAKTVTMYHTNIHNLKKLNPKTVVKMFNRWNLLGKPDILDNIIQCVTNDVQGRGEEYENMEHPNRDLLLCLAEAYLRKVDVEEINRDRVKPLSGQGLGNEINSERIRRVAKAKEEFLNED